VQSSAGADANEGGVVRAGACGRLVECAEVAPVLRYVTVLKKPSDLTFVVFSAQFYCTIPNLVPFMEFVLISHGKSGPQNGTRAGMS